MNRNPTTAQKDSIRRRKAVVRLAALRRSVSLEPLESRSMFSGTVTGSIINDADNDGIRNNGEGGLQGWTVYADVNNDGTFNAGEPSGVSSGGGGNYTISAVPAGNITVREVLASGWVPSTGNSASRVVVVQDNRTTSKVDFLNFRQPVGNVTGVVWKDINGDGTRGATDPAMPGITVFDDANNNGLPDAGETSTTTDTAGLYTLSNLPANDRQITEVLPAGYTTSRGFSTTQRVRVLDASTVQARDFSNISTTEGVIQGTVWNDLNADSLRATDPVTGAFTDPGLSGWTVFIDLNTNRLLDPGEASTVTDAAGAYEFSGLAPANYDIVEVLKPGWSTSALFGIRNTVNVRAGQVSTGNDFANFGNLNGSLSGSMWNDLDRDGTHQAGEPGLTGWSVYLDLNRNGARDESEPFRLTDALGHYEFADLQAGHYNVVEIVQPGWVTTGTSLSSYEVDVNGGTNSLVPDFSNALIPPPPPSTILGAVWEDVNGNAVRDAADLGLAGWTVFLDTNGNALPDAGETQAVTAADGSYSIGGLATGTVSLRLVLKAGFRSSNPVTTLRTLFVSGGSTNVVDFGVAQVREASISGNVFFDANRNGLRDPAERGLPGITLFLDANNNGTLDLGEESVTSSSDRFFTPSVDEAGNYSFTHLPAGTHVVRAVLPVTLSATAAEQLVHTLTLTATQVTTGINTAAVFRPNEIHGTKFDDTNGNHVRDPGEPLVANAEIYIDSDRNGSWDSGEPLTTTGADGSYAFLGLTPGSYVVRERHRFDHEYTYPGTTGGILWPAGTSNPAQGIVSPGSITLALSKDQTSDQHVSLTLPGSGSLSNKVDVFLLFDDTGSFVGNSPIVRAAFPSIINQLQVALPGVDFGFGVGRFEEYGNFASEFSTGRPFTLNQPVVAASTPGYMTAIQAALNRTTPGYGGDAPETDIEALYQLVTGLGFDGNNNGSTDDSGPAGPASTQLNPGVSGDVPSFASFTADPANSIFAPAGSLGGGGFRAGALPIILTATDIGFAYQPKGETSITGVGGVSLPVSQLTQFSRASTPFGYGAGLQETVTGLNALGALVIGLGTNPQTNLDPRQALSALSKLTGAVNRTATPIPNGTTAPINPGDPLYFQIQTGFADSVSSGVVSAIQNAATSVAYDITVQASDPRVKISNFTGTIAGVGSGQTASFDVRFTGDGAPRRFDLQFVRAGTGVVLGSIPVVIGTPIEGDNYHYIELEDGEHSNDHSFGSRAVALPAAGVRGRFVFAGATSEPATDKQALFAGQPATFANYVNSSRGLTAVVVDVANAAVPLTLADFSLKAGNNSDVASWSDAPTPVSLTRLAGTGVGGADRYVIRFADNAIRNRWLSVTTLANADTRLASPDTFYFGAAPGDVNVGNTVTHAIVNSADADEIRRHFSTAAVAGDPYDIDGDGLVNDLDADFALGHTTSAANALRLITPTRPPLSAKITGPVGIPVVHRTPTVEALPLDVPADPGFDLPISAPALLGTPMSAGMSEGMSGGTSSGISGSMFSARPIAAFPGDSEILDSDASLERPLTFE